MSKRKTIGSPELIYMDLTSNHEVCFCFTRRVAIGYVFFFSGVFCFNEVGLDEIGIYDKSKFGKPFVS